MRLNCTCLAWRIWSCCVGLVYTGTMLVLIAESLMMMLGERISSPPLAVVIERVDGAHRVAGEPGKKLEER